MNLQLFKNDQHLVHGDISIENSLTPPAGWGTYSIRLPDDSLTQQTLAKIKILLWSCMDRRVVRLLYNQLITQGYAPETIMVVSMGGGPIQYGDERVEAVTTAFAELTTKLTSLEKIWAVAHTAGCGGLKHFCGGKLVTEIAKPEIIKEAQEKRIDVEVYLTDLLLEDARKMLPENWQTKVTFAIAAPDETNKTITLYAHATSDERTLSDILA